MRDSGWHGIRACVEGPGLINNLDGRTIFLRDTVRYLDRRDIFQVKDDELEKIYEELKPHLEAELERRRNLKPSKLERLHIPLVRKIYPQL